MTGLLTRTWSADSSSAAADPRPIPVLLSCLLVISALPWHAIYFGCTFLVVNVACPAEAYSAACARGDAMDAELTALSSTAAATLVALMTTDAWGRAKAALVGLWRRRHPEQATAVEADLAAAQLEVAAARQVGDSSVEAELTSEWQSRLRRLVAGDEQLQAELALLVENLRPAVPDSGQAGSVAMRASACGRSRINQAGRDQTIISG